MLKAVIFDFDGTLGDTLALCLTAAHRVVEPMLGRKITDEEILATFGPNEEGAFRKLVPQEIYEEALNAYIHECKRLLSFWPDLFPGVRELLHELKRRGLILAVVTGRGRKTCDDALKFYGIYDLFDQIETGIETGPSKPLGLRRILENFRLTPLETVYIGDAPGDISACREVGVPIFSAAWASTAKLEPLMNLNPDAIFQDISALQTQLEKMMDDTHFL